MVYAHIQDVVADEDFHRRVLAELGPQPVDGSLLHLCVRRPDGGLRYIDVWESEELCRTAMADRILPAVDAVSAGNRPPAPQTEVLDVVSVTWGVSPHLSG